jgi:hypothetical protein
MIFLPKYLVEREKMRTFAPVQWNEELDKSSSFFIKSSIDDYERNN